MAVTSAQIQQLYVGYFGRPADQAGLNYWLAAGNNANSTTTLNDIRASFAQQSEYLTGYSYTNSAGATVTFNGYGSLTRQQTVETIYENLFGRDASDAEVAYWTFTSANTPTENLIQAFLEAASPSDRAVVDAKAAFADQLTGIYGSATGTNFADPRATYAQAVQVAETEQDGPNPPAASASYEAAFTSAVSSLGFTFSSGASGTGAAVFDAFDKTSATVSIPAVAATGTELASVDVNGNKLTSVTVDHAYGANAAGPLSIDYAGAANLTSLNLNLTATGTSDDVTLTLTGPATSKLTTLNASGSDVDLTFNASSTALTNITTGSGADDITIATSTTTSATAPAKVVALNTGAGNDVVSATVNEANVQINTGAGNDSVTLNFGTNTANHGAEIALGAGQDNIFLGTGHNVQFYTGSDAAKASQLDAAMVRVSGFSGSEGDVFHGATGTTTTTYYDLSAVSQGSVSAPNTQLVAFNNATTLAGKLEAASVLMSSTGNTQTGATTIHFEFNGNTYVYADATTAGTFGQGDSVVELTGVTGLANAAFA